MKPSPDAIARFAAELGIPAERLAIAVPLLLAMGGTDTHDELLAVAKLEIEQAGVRAEIKSGRLPAVKIGRALYVRRSDLLRLIPETGTPAVKRAPPRTEVTLADLAEAERSRSTRRRSA